MGNSGCGKAVVQGAYKLSIALSMVVYSGKWMREVKLCSEDTKGAGLISATDFWSWQFPLFSFSLSLFSLQASGHCV